MKIISAAVQLLYAATRHGEANRLIFTTSSCDRACQAKSYARYVTLEI
jgi:hypothetical protein